MINGTYLKNETGPPMINGPALIGDNVTPFYQKSSQYFMCGIIYRFSKICFEI